MVDWRCNTTHPRTEGTSVDRVTPSIVRTIARLFQAIALTLLIGLAIGTSANDAAAQDEDRAQDRPSLTKVDVPIDKIEVDDGDTVTIDWGETGQEIVRILGIDTPETQHLPHNLPYAQSFGREAAGFAMGAFAAATEVQILRTDQKDQYGRSLAYLFINGMNYSVLVVKARLAAESVSHYGDNGFPEEAQAVLEAARATGPVPFEPPHQYRRRMREVSEWMRDQGIWPIDP